MYVQFEHEDGARMAQAILGVSEIGYLYSLPPCNCGAAATTTTLLCFNFECILFWFSILSIL